MNYTNIFSFCSFFFFFGLCINIASKYRDLIIILGCPSKLFMCSLVSSLESPNDSMKIWHFIDSKSNIIRLVLLEENERTHKCCYLVWSFYFKASFSRFGKSHRHHQIRSDQKMQLHEHELDTDINIIYVQCILMHAPPSDASSCFISSLDKVLHCNIL